MELWCIVLICSLALAALCLLAYLLVLRHSLREAAEELDEKLRTDTNTLISISSGDRAMQSLVTHINRQLQALRRERLRLHSGNAELAAAFTNISHDLRTPLTVLCGYLDLLEQEPQTEAAARYLAVLRERTDAMRALTEELFRYSVLTATADELHTEPVCQTPFKGLVRDYGKQCAPCIVTVFFDKGYRFGQQLHTAQLPVLPPTVFQPQCPVVVP